MQNRPIWKPIFHGRAKYCEQAFVCSDGRPIFQRGVNGSYEARARRILLALYNDGHYVYADTTNSWPRMRFESDTPWKLLQYTDFQEPARLAHSPCLVRHGGHWRGSGISLARMHVDTPLQNRWKIDLHPRRIYYVIDFGTVDALFVSKNGCAVATPLALQQPC